MSNDAPILPEDPAVLKAMIAALQVGHTDRDTRVELETI